MSIRGGKRDLGGSRFLACRSDCCIGVLHADTSNLPSAGKFSHCKSAFVCFPGLVRDGLRVGGRVHGSPATSPARHSGGDGRERCLDGASCVHGIHRQADEGCTHADDAARSIKSRKTHCGDGNAEANHGTGGGDDCCRCLRETLGEIGDIGDHGANGVHDLVQRWQQRIAHTYGEIGDLVLEDLQRIRRRLRALLKLILRATGILRLVCHVAHNFS